MIIVIVLFLILIWRGVVIATKAPDMFSGLLATGITMLIAVQLLFNIAIITSWFPVTGMPVPFMSYGGSFTICLIASLTIVQRVSVENGMLKEKGI